MLIVSVQMTAKAVRKVKRPLKRCTWTLLMQKIWRKFQRPGKFGLQKKNFIIYAYKIFRILSANQRNSLFPQTYLLVTMEIDFSEKKALLRKY
jgi:hypothetical protein